MSLSIWIGGKRFKGHMSLGWYNGEDWQLINLALLHWTGYTFYVIEFSILKFNLCIFFDKESE